MNKNLSARGGLALFGASLIYVLFSVFARLMSKMWGDNAQVSARFTIAFLVMLAFGYLRHQKFQIPKDKIKNVVALGFSFSMVVTFFTLAVLRTTIANTTFLYYGASMICSFLVGTFVFKEKVNTGKAVALVLALGGLALYSGSIFAASLGILFALVSGVFDSSSNILRRTLAGIDRATVLRAQYGTGVIVLLAITAFSSQPVIKHASGWGILLTLLYGVMLTQLGSLLLYGFQHFDVNIGTVVLSSEIALSVLVGWIFYNEVPAMHEMIGGTMILVAAVISGLQINVAKFLPRYKKA